MRAAPEVTLPPVSCTLYASPRGDDAGPGTARRPLRFVATLVDRLRPGQTGCLERGVYDEDLTFHRGGTPGHPVVLAGAPGARKPTLLGSLWIAGDAPHVTIRDLRIDGRLPGDAPSPQVNGSYATFYDVDVTNAHTGICFVVGGAAATFGLPVHTTIARSRIHDCGRLPPSHLEHGIYLDHSRGATIVDNYVYDNADFGLHLYPDAQGSNVQYNVVDGNGDGVMIAGTDQFASSGNTVAHNVFSNTQDRSAAGDPANNYGYQVTSFWGQKVGSGNLVADNCFWRGVSGDVNVANGGFTEDDNTVADPRYVSRAAKDFRLAPGSPCAGDGPRAR